MQEPPRRRFLPLAAARYEAGDLALSLPAGVGSGQPAAPAEVDSARQAQAKQYARRRQVLSLVNLAVSALLVSVLLFTPLDFALRDALTGASGWQPVRGWHPFVVGAYFLVVFAASTLLTLPLSYYSSFVLAHRYGLSTQTRRGWLFDLLKGLVISLPFELLAVEFVYALLALAPDTWWIWAGIAVLCVTVLLANLAPILFLPLFYKLTPLPDGEIRRLALELAARANTRVRGIYSMNMSKRTTAANAMVMGLGNTRRIVLGDTLLDRYTPDEIEVVLAHELGHQVHHDIPKLIMIEVVTTLGGLFAVNLALHAVVGAVPGYASLADAATLPLVAAALGIFGLVT
ncbi:MAG: M48 family metallopeptidase, partial [Ktedonobacterales bacterium]